MKSAFWRVQEALNNDFIVLKGFANWENYWPDPERRIQYDLDLFCPDPISARNKLIQLGYEETEQRSRIDHLPPLVPKTNWRWNGDFFDPEMPLAVEIHFRLWDEETEGFSVPGLQIRRVVQTLDGKPYFALHPIDSLGYACLHLLRHLLRGDVRAANVYEIAYFLDKNTQNSHFWGQWRSLKGAGVCFLLAKTWFECELHPVAQEEIDRLDPRILKWFEKFAWSPLEAIYRPNKDEVWLHLLLVDSVWTKAKILTRRLAPLQWPRAPYVSRIQNARYVAERALFHARALSRMLKIWA